MTTAVGGCAPTRRLADDVIEVIVAVAAVVMTTRLALGHESLHSALQVLVELPRNFRVL